MAIFSILEEKRREVQRKETSKACRRHSKTERGRVGRKELKRFNRGELKLRHFLQIPQPHFYFSRCSPPHQANISLLPIVILSHSQPFASTPPRPVTSLCPALSRSILGSKWKEKSKPLPLKMSGSAGWNLCVINVLNFFSVSGPSLCLVLCTAEECCGLGG